MSKWQRRDDVMLRSLNCRTKPAFPAAEEEAKEAQASRGPHLLLTKVKEKQRCVEARGIPWGRKW